MTDSFQDLKSFDALEPELLKSRERFYCKNTAGMPVDLLRLLRMKDRQERQV